MSVNRDLPHIMVLPEDDANRQLALGFHLQVNWNCKRQMQVLRAAGGWREVLDRFRVEHIPQMLRQPNRFMVLLIDCDGDENRLENAKAVIPSNLTSRVFILGAFTEPEKLKPDLGGYERIGAGMATDCRNGTDQIWGHPLLRHNAGEVARLRESVRPILFGLD